MGNNFTTIAASAVTSAEGYYAKRAKMLLRAGPGNLASYSNLDSDTTAIDEANLQAAMDWADNYVDTRARVLGLTADTAATTPRMLATANTFFARVSDLASDIAVAYLYAARGFTGDTQETVEGQMADMDAKARKELDEVLDAARVQQAIDGGSVGAAVYTSCPTASYVLPAWGWW
jgi:VIT1/CCC1 family predicted Fe2+/Mn2+ transporter